MPKHRDAKHIQGEANGNQKLLRETPIMSFTLFALMQYHTWDPENENKEEFSAYELPAEKHYTKNMGMHLLEQKSLLIWHPCDDERYMHSLDFPPELLKDTTQSYCRLSYVWRWTQHHEIYFTSGPNYGSAIPYSNVMQDWNGMCPHKYSGWVDHNLDLDDDTETPSSLKDLLGQEFTNQTMMKIISTCLVV
jgi:hypothetical protein